MKSIMITDEHFGVGNGDINIYNIQKQGFTEMFKYMKENNINHIFSLGDFFDNRNTINVQIMNNIMKDFFDYLKENDITITIIVGNHNIFYKDSLEITNLDFIDKIYDNVTLIKQQTIFDFNNKDILLVPWLLSGEQIKHSNVDLILAHAEINGFYVSSTTQFNSEHGLNREKIKVKTISGHFHSYQEQDNICYLGNSFTQTTWSDFNEEKGFWVLNEDLTKEFISCNTMRHLKVYLNSETKECTVEGFKETLQTKINTKTNYDFLKGHKLKVFIDKDNAFNKKIIEKLVQLAFKIRVEVPDEELLESSLIDENIKIGDYNLKHTISTYIETDFQKEIFEDIYKKAELDLI